MNEEKIALSLTEEFTKLIAFYKAIGLSKEELMALVEDIYDSIVEANIVS
jgi:DNA-binding transcriptional regulator YhcF (GntR family)